MGGGKSLFLLIVSLFFVNVYFSSCAKEKVAPEASAEVVTAKKKGEDGLEKDLPSDCNCYMRILSVSGYDNRIWAMWQVEDDIEQEFSFFGRGNTWVFNGNFLPLPSEFRPLVGFDVDCHHLVVSLTEGVSEDEVIFTSEVKCYQGGSLATTTYHQFVISPGEELSHFWRRFLCRYLTGDESSDCSLTSDGPTI